MSPPIIRNYDEEPNDCSTMATGVLSAVLNLFDGIPSNDKQAIIYLLESVPNVFLWTIFIVGFFCPTIFDYCAMFVMRFKAIVKIPFTAVWSFIILCGCSIGVSIQAAKDMDQPTEEDSFETAYEV
uniref:Na_Ca_ex domain-containing protein n=1 Tax=Caenorhabditis tropicalis TaxID=1561998 RepID=A0A1I7T2T9_9PELO